MRVFLHERVTNRPLRILIHIEKGGRIPSGRSGGEKTAVRSDHGPDRGRLPLHDPAICARRRGRGSVPGNCVRDLEKPGQL
jgi:hypothetical protein